MTRMHGSERQPGAGTPEQTVLGAITATARRYLFLVGGIGLFINLAMLTVPLYMLQLYDRVLVSRNESTLVLLTLVAVVLLGALGLLELVRSRMLVRMGRWFDEQLRTWLIHLAINNGRDSQAIRDLDEFRSFLTGPGLLALMDAPWTPIFVFAVFLLHPLLGVIALAGACLLAGLAVANELASRRILSEAGRHATAANRFSDLVARNAEAIRAMAMSGALIARWEQERGAATELQTRGSDRVGAIGAFAKFLRLLLQVSVLGTGAWLAIREVVTPGVMIAASILAARALAPVEVAIGAWRNVVMARDAYRRLDAFLADYPDEPDPMELPPPEGRVRVERLSLKVARRDRPVLFDVAFELEPGEQLGIIGPSAAGKSTLARTLVGIHEPTTGHVRIDGFDVRNWNRDQLGPAIGYVPQDVELFDGRIDENIARFTEVDAAAVVRAARRAGVYEMIAALPDGFATRIGLGGELLSGGQRQRIALARALYGEPRLVVLDEPSSNLDPEGDHALREALHHLREDGVTVILIAHRPHLLTQVDQILVLEQGRVALYGPTAEVLPKITRRLVSDAPGAGAKPGRVVRPEPAQGG